MSRESACVDCGSAFPVASNFGPLAKRCPACAPAYSRAASAARRARRAASEVGTPRVVHCIDCKKRLDWAGTGRPKLRCSDCLTVHAREMSRVRYASEVAEAPELARERWRQGYRRNAERIRAQKLDQHYRKRYGLTTVEVEALREARDGLCQICGRKPSGKGPQARLHVDHCHTTGKVRGLLCGNCNTMIGLAAEDPKILLAAVEYLKKE